MKFMDTELTPLDKLYFYADGVKKKGETLKALCERLGKDFATDDDNPNQCGNCNKQIPVDMDYCKECQEIHDAEPEPDMEPKHPTLMEPYDFLKEK